MSKTRKPGPYDKLTALIAGAKVVSGMSDEDIVAATGISRSRLLARRREPQKYSLGELRKLRVALRIDPDDMRAALL